MLTKITVDGFKSIDHAEVELREGLTLLIGPSGAGKSNLLNALQLACEVGMEDTASTFLCGAEGMGEFLHHGREVGPRVELRFTSEHQGGEVGYPVKMEVVDDYRLISEHGLGSADEAGREVQKTLAQARFYHFRDARSIHTPPRKNTISQITPRDEEDDVRTLRSDGSNLALLLYTISQSQDEKDRRAWTFIQGLVRQVAPFIRELRPTPQVAPHTRELRSTPLLSHPRFPEAFSLSWVDERGVVQHPSRLSDGTLRIIALFTVILQPNRPSIISIDEPELSQPTATLELFMELVHSTKHAGQVLMATQSNLLIDRVTDVMLVKQHDGKSTFTRYDSVNLSGWLEDYTLSELYAKNVLGGFPGAGAHAAKR